MTIAIPKSSLSWYKEKDSLFKGLLYPLPYFISYLTDNSELFLFRTFCRCRISEIFMDSLPGSRYMDWSYEAYAAGGTHFFGPIT